MPHPGRRCATRSWGWSAVSGMCTAPAFPGARTLRLFTPKLTQNDLQQLIYPDSSKTREKFLVFFGLADSAWCMIRGGFLTWPTPHRLLPRCLRGAGARCAVRPRRRTAGRDRNHVNVDTLSTAFYALKRKAAAGVDGVTWQDYEADLGRNLEDLHGRVHRGTYRPQPSRRTYIPKRMVGKGRWRSQLWRTRSSRAHAS
jgi:hypothetical protein